MDILVFKLAALGDVVRTTSLLKPLLARYPGARVTWVTSAAARPLLAGVPEIAELLVWGTDAARTLEGRRFELVLSMEEEPAIAALLERLEAREVVGVVADDKGSLTWTPSASEYYAMSLLNRRADGSLEQANALKAANRKTYVQLWCGILGLAAPAPPPRPLLALDEGDRAGALELAVRLGPRPWIGLNPGAGARWPAKRLSEDRSAAVARLLHDSFGGTVLLLGGPDERERNQAIAAKAGPAAADAGTDHSLRAFAAVLARCSALVTADSLALHLAHAVGTPAVAFVGPTSSAELDVYARGRVLTPPGGCADFYKARCTQDVPCLDRIPDADFIGAVREALA